MIAGNFIHERSTFLETLSTASHAAVYSAFWGVYIDDVKLRIVGVERLKSPDLGTSGLRRPFSSRASVQRRAR